MRFLTLFTALTLTGISALACTEDADIAQQHTAATGGKGSQTEPKAGATFVQTGGSSNSSTTTAAGGSTAVTPQTTRSDVVPITNPDITDAEYAQFIQDANAFGFQLAQKAEAVNNLTTGNVAFSPSSAQIALAMAYAGAAGDTATAMASTLHDGFGSAKYHAGCNRMLRDLKSRNYEGKSPFASEPLRIELAPANSLWTEQTLNVKTSFLDLLSQNYDSGMQRVNFLTAAEPARLAINQWVMDHTHDKIKDLLNPGDVDASTRLVLVNALYLYANWAELFDASITKPAAFNTLAGAQVQADMMHDTRDLEYKSTDQFEVVKLPYVTQSLWMTLVLPKAGQFEAVRAAAAAPWLTEVTSGLTSHNVQLSLPKFKIETAQIDLTEPLKQLGMGAAFGGTANFTGIADSTLFITKVVQKAFIGVDEKGTEAAAATALAMAGAVPAQPITLTFDRPFLFFIQDKTGLVLFSGHVVDPTK